METKRREPNTVGTTAAVFLNLNLNYLIWLIDNIEAIKTLKGGSPAQWELQLFRSIPSLHSSEDPHSKQWVSREWDSAGNTFQKSVQIPDPSPSWCSDENQAFVASGHTAFSRQTGAAQARVILVLGILLVGWQGGQVRVIQVLGLVLAAQVQALALLLVGQRKGQDLLVLGVALVG